MLLRHVAPLHRVLVIQTGCFSTIPDFFTMFAVVDGPPRANGAISRFLLRTYSSPLLMFCLFDGGRVNDWSRGHLQRDLLQKGREKIKRRRRNDCLGATVSPSVIISVGASRGRAHTPQHWPRIEKGGGSVYASESRQATRLSLLVGSRGKISFRPKIKTKKA